MSRSSYLIANKTGEKRDQTCQTNMMDPVGLLNILSDLVESVLIVVREKTSVGSRAFLVTGINMYNIFWFTQSA